VDGRLHAALVRPVSHRPHKRRWRHPAGPAKSGTRRAGLYRRVQRVAAACAQLSTLHGNLRPANLANGHGTEMRQRVPAKDTRGRKESTTQGVHGTSQHTNHCAPTGSPRGWNVECQ
jgi:hypothetical protein